MKESQERFKTCEPFSIGTSVQKHDIISIMNTYCSPFAYRGKVRVVAENEVNPLEL